MQRLVDCRCYPCDACFAHAVSVALALVEEERRRCSEVAREWILYFGKPYDADGIRAQVLCSDPIRCAPQGEETNDADRR